MGSGNKHQEQKQVQQQPRPVTDKADSFPGTASMGFLLPVADIKMQDEKINEMDGKGWEHYESIKIGGGEIILRFRRKK